MGKKKENKKISKKETKRAIKESKRFIKDIFDKIEGNAPNGGVDIIVIPIRKRETITVDNSDQRFISEESLSDSPPLPLEYEKPIPKGLKKIQDGFMKDKVKIFAEKLLKGSRLKNDIGIIGEAIAGNPSDEGILSIQIKHIPNGIASAYKKGYNYYVDISDWNILPQEEKEVE